MTLINIQIGRSGGTTLRVILEGIYPDFNAMNLIYHGYTDVRDVGPNNFFKLSEEEREKINCWAGHFPFGLHRYLSGDCVYLVLFREPVDRLVSVYYHILDISAAHPDGEVIKNMSLEDFVCKYCMNEETAYVAGIPIYNSEMGMSMPSDVLDVAMKNLERFFIFGLVERFDESVEYFRKLFDWPKVATGFHATGVRPRVDEISSSTIDIIKEHNTLDLKLYDYAKRMFEKKLF